MTTINARTTEKEIAHLVRRVGFGGSKEEIDFLSNKSISMRGEKILKITIFI